MGKKYIRLTYKFLLFLLLFSFTFSNMLFPLASFSKFEKVLIILSVFFLFLGTLFFLNFKSEFFSFKVNKEFWKIFIFSLFISIFIFSIIPIRLPYFPINEKIIISTNSPDVGFSYITRQFDIDSSSFLKPEYIFSGSWNTKQSGWLWEHKGNDEGEIYYQGTTLIREPIKYEIGFIGGGVDSEVEIEVNGESYHVLIPSISNSEDEKIFSFFTDSQIISSYSSLWKVIVFIYPLMNFLTLFLILFMSILNITNKTKNKKFAYLKSSIFVILFYLFWLALPYQNRFYSMENRAIVPFISVLFLFVLIPIIIFFYYKKYSKYKILFFIGIVFLAIGVRVYWINMVHSVPVSDFGDFHRWALQIVNGSTDRIYIDRYPNFVRLLALFYRITPSIKSVQFINIILSAGTAALLGGIFWVNNLYKEALIASYLFAIFPSELAMVSLVNTDIPSVFFLVLSVFLFVIFIKNNKWWGLVLSSLAFCLSNIIRGALIIYITVFVVGMIVHYFKNKSLKKLLSNALLFVVVFVVGSKVIGFGINKIQTDGLVIEEGYYMIWPLVNGVNIDSLGRTNDADNAMVHSWNAEDATKLGLKVVINRLVSDPIGFYSIIGEKFEYIFADATYMTLWAFVDESLETYIIDIGWNAEVKEVQIIFAQVSQYAYIIVLIFALIGSFKFNFKNSALFILPSTIILSSLLAYTFFEVQPRYQRPIIPFLLMIAGFVFSKWDFEKSKV